MLDFEGAFLKVLAHQRGVFGAAVSELGGELFPLIGLLFHCSRIAPEGTHQAGNSLSYHSRN